MERRVGKLFDDIESSLSEDERNARIDIKYRQSGGKHIVIELKRPNVRVSVYDLCKQIGKYRNGIQGILNKQGLQNESVEFVCLLGEEPIEMSQIDGQRLVNTMLGAVDARCVYYDQLLSNAFKAYDDYLKRAKRFDHLSDVVRAIENYPESSQ